MTVSIDVQHYKCICVAEKLNYLKKKIIPKIKYYCNIQLRKKRKKKRLIESYYKISRFASNMYVL